MLDLFEQLHRERGITIIVVMHDPNIARRANRIISIKDGHIESDIANASANATEAPHLNGAVQATPELVPAH